jgi:hypothetical protein
MADQLPRSRWLAEHRAVWDVPQLQRAACVRCTHSTIQTYEPVQQIVQRLLALRFTPGQATQQHAPLSRSFGARHVVFADHNRSLIPPLIPMRAHSAT